jgi:hypothetical protein
MALICHLYHLHHSLLLQASVSSIRYTYVKPQLNLVNVIHKISAFKDLTLFVWIHLLLDISELWYSVFSRQTVHGSAAAEVLR